jgi:hypothetical protein
VPKQGILLSPCGHSQVNAARELGGNPTRGLRIRLSLRQHQEFSASINNSDLTIHFNDATWFQLGVTRPRTSDFVVALGPDRTAALVFQARYGTPQRHCVALCVSSSNASSRQSVGIQVRLWFEVRALWAAVFRFGQPRTASSSLCFARNFHSKDCS